MGTNPVLNGLIRRRKGEPTVDFRKNVVGRRPAIPCDVENPLADWTGDIDILGKF
jgi:hypothetical protein